MDVFEAIRSRRSIGKVRDEAPPRELIERLLAAAIEAPNHYETEPWRFIVLAGKAREEFGDRLAEALRRRLAGADVKNLDGLLLAERAKPLRAPVLIIVATKRSPQKNVVPIEEIEATAAAVENMLLTATALGLAAHWRTGDGAYDPYVKQWFGLDPEDHVAAVVYLGYPDPERDTPRTRSRSFTNKTEWRGWD